MRSKGSFATFGLPKNILRAVSDIGFQEPRPIQARTIPQVMQGRDVLGLAQTGTGKTAAFALPIIDSLLEGRGRSPRALILAPTRELAIQIHAEIEQLAKYTNVRAITLFGGVGAKPQVRALKSNPDILVACPGRLLDLAGSGDVRLNGIETLVLDEADHMLDMGFLPDIKRIIARLPARRQNLMFSATMPREIRGLADRVLHDPHVVEIEITTALETIEHALYPVDQKRKTALLRHLLGAGDFESAIVFLRTKHRARRLAQDLDKAGHRAIALQGNMSQSQRQRAMQGFRDGRYDVLVATDIAARGIDVAKVSHVVNFDIPNTPDAYTHRIGRTGRAECSGKAYTFVTTEDFPSIKAIERKLKMEIPRVKLRDFAGSTAGGERDELDRGRRGGKPFARQSGAAGPRSRTGRQGARSRPGASGDSKPGITSRSISRAAASTVSFGSGVGGSSPREEEAGNGRSKTGRRRQRTRDQAATKGQGGNAGQRGARPVRGRGQKRNRGR